MNLIPTYAHKLRYHIIKREPAHSIYGAKERIRYINRVGRYLNRFNMF